MAKKVLHQVVETALINDATSDHVFLMRRWLRELDFTSEIYALHCQAELENEVRSFTPSTLAQEAFVIFHHAI
jgi:hypothetical protein